MTKIKIGRNDPCHCGSGQKYKRCCQEKDDAEDRAARPKIEAPKSVASLLPALKELFTNDINDELAQLTEDSNAVINMVRAGQLDEAEHAARELLVRFPDFHHGYDRLGMVYEARGDHEQAAQCYRKVIDFVRSRSDQYEPRFEDTFHRLIQKLDPAAAD